MAKRGKKKPGPKPKHLKIKGNWTSAVKKAIKKDKPENGWPEEDKNEKKTE